jgi:hypothetical protein
MSLDQNLMGFGMTGELASRVATGGTGPIKIAAAGSSATTGTQIRARQFIVYINSGSGWVTLPSATEAGDPLHIGNGLASPVTVGIPTGQTVQLGGSFLTGNFTLLSGKTADLFMVDGTTQWSGQSN